DRFQNAEELIKALKGKATTSTNSAVKLVSKVPNSPISEFLLGKKSVIIGIFDPNSSPIDIDLQPFLGSDTVSRQHAEIYQENGIWKIKDLGSTNGIFLKPSGQRRFSARITQPEVLNIGDEIAIAKIRFLFQAA
ncbi:MAG: FHA domain-containing protein, partial [Halothece sp.]